MRIINFADGASSETTPTIGSISASSLVKYVNDAAYEAAELAAPATGNVYYNTTDNTIRYYNGTKWQELIDEDTTQALENKSIDADNNMITNIDNNEIKPLAGIEATKLADGSVTDTELQYINTLSSNAQTQLDVKQNTSEKSAVNGYASLDGTGKVPAAELPSYVDDVLEFADLASFPATGETGKIYIALDTNSTYRWTGSVYVEISTSGGASQDLSNLTSTAINQSLYPGTTDTLEIGKAANRWLFGHFQKTLTRIVDILNSSDIAKGRLSTDETMPDASSAEVSIQGLTQGDDIGIHTLNSTGATPSGDISNQTGNQSGSADSGDVINRPGTVSTGTRGKIRNVDGTEGTVGHFWKSSDTLGGGEWVVPNKYQTKTLATSKQSNGTLTDLTFNSLVIGKEYLLTGQIYYILDAGSSDPSALVDITHDGTIIRALSVSIVENAATGADSLSICFNIKFTATATTVTFVGSSLSTASYIFGSGTERYTSAQIEERNDLETTTDFT